MTTPLDNEAFDALIREIDRKTGDRVRLIPFADIKLSTRPRDLVKGLIPRVGMTVLWGPPKCGKSFWLFDCLMHIALGWEYRGRRIQQGPVVYCAFEGQTGIEARAEAFRLKHLVDYDREIPFYLEPVTLDLVKDHQALIQAISKTLGKGTPPIAVALDTLNRSLAGSESKDEDMSAYVRAADAIRAAFECAVIIVHHCGIDGSRPRGHTALTGATDAQLAVKRDGANNIIVEIELAKDGPQGDTIASRLEVVVVGTDDDNEEITSCIVVPLEHKPQRGTAKTKWTPGLRVFRDAVTEAILNSGTEHNVAGAGPAVRAVDIQQARDVYSRKYISSGEGDRAAALRQAWKRNLNTARNNGLIGCETMNGLELLWLCDA